MTSGPAADTSVGCIDDQLIERVNTKLEEYLARRRRDTEAVHPEVAKAAGRLVDFVLSGGKRIRPTFAWWGWRGAGGSGEGAESEAALTAVSALELVQANALVHDDLIDASATRRGQPTVHVDFAGRHRTQGWLGSPARFGSAAAILLGDLALAWADDMFDQAFDQALDQVADQVTEQATTGAVNQAEPSMARPTTRRLSRLVWSGMRTEVISGQYLDIWSQVTGDDSTEAALRVNRFKTAAYTIERPLELGATLAGADAQLIAAFRGFGADIGIAFQLRDDLLGVFGDPAVTGKPAGDDLREGKRTLLMALAFATARRREDHTCLAVLTQALGNPNLDERSLHRVREVLDELGTPNELEQRIDQLTESALDTLATAGLAEPAASKLTELARAATRRQH